MRPDQAVLAELSELDRALAGEPSPLAQLVADVRAERPRMDPAFAARLDALVDDARPAAPPRRPRWVVWSPAVGLAAALVVAIVVVGNRGNGSPPTAAPLGGAPAAGEAASGKAPAAGAPATAAPSAQSAVPATPILPAPGRRVERSTSLSLSTARGDVQNVADDVVATTQRYGGIVDASQISTSDSDASASFSLRIPAARLDDAVAALSKLAHVSSLQQGSTDITGAFASVLTQLRDARAERRALLRALAQATSTQEIEAIKAQLRDNRSQLAALDGQLSALRRRTGMSQVYVSVAGNGQKGTGGSGPWTPGDAARDALRVLEVAAGVILVGLAGGLPLALVAAAAGLAARGARRRRRESALGPV